MNMIIERTELSVQGREEMREKFKGRNPKHAAYAHLSDEAVANAIYIAQRQDLDLAAVQSAARDRIMHLSIWEEENRMKIVDLVFKIDNLRQKIIKMETALIKVNDAMNVLRPQCTNGSDVADVLDSFIPSVQECLK